jgi:hypothetical protein
MLTMKVFFFILLGLASAIAAEPKDAWHGPVMGFSEAIAPILDGFEKANVKTTLRGFIARGDTSPGFAASEIDPSEDGLYLNVAVRDAEEVPSLLDKVEKKGAITYRLVEIPARPGREQGLRISLHYGPGARAEAIRAIDGCIGKIKKAANGAEKPPVIPKGKPPQK